jgi:hypothetical protein
MPTIPTSTAASTFLDLSHHHHPIFVINQILYFVSCAKLDVQWGTIFLVKFSIAHRGFWVCACLVWKYIVQQFIHIFWLQGQSKFFYEGERPCSSSFNFINYYAGLLIVHTDHRWKCNELDQPLAALWPPNRPFYLVFSNLKKSTTLNDF